MTDSAPCRRAGRETGAPVVRAVYGAGAAVFVAYAVWGSLFPFDFHRVPPADLARAWTASTLPGATWSLTDLLSNVLLFLPIGLCAAAFVETGWPERDSKAGVLAAAFGCAVGLSVAIELGQAFVSARTPSIVDVFAEAGGTAAGFLIWRIVREELDALLRLIARSVIRATPAERMLLAYCCAFAIAWVLPGDVTLRPGEIGDKFEHKRLLLPFMSSPDAVTPAGLVFTVIAAIPLGAAAVLCGCGRQARRSAAAAWTIVAALLAALELAQATVFSRTTDGTAFVAALVGAGCGAVAAAAAKRQRVVVIGAPTLFAVMSIAAWFAVTVVLSWWPFDVVLDPHRAAVQTVLWSRAPFRAPMSAFDVAPGAVMAAAAGFALGPRLSSRFTRLHALLILGLAGCVFLVLESARVLLDGKQPTLVTVAIQSAALAFSLFVGRSASAPLFLRRQVG